MPILDAALHEPVLLLGLIAFALLLIALPWAFWALSSGRSSGAVRTLVALANLAFTAQLVLRWWQSGHFPISNLYESLCFLEGCPASLEAEDSRAPSPGKQDPGLKAQVGLLDLFIAQELTCWRLSQS